MELVMLPGDDPAEVSRVLDAAYAWAREENPGETLPACGDEEPHAAYPEPAPDDPFAGHAR
jgi:hypothetical protein